MGFKTLFIYPKLGSGDAFITYPPLSLIYAASELVKRGKNISILDLRFYPNNYLEEIKKNITPDLKLVGISVMTGSPIKYALEISRYLKENFDVLIVWGGAHPSLLPEQTLENKYIDYVISGYGSMAAAGLIEAIEGSRPLKDVPNLYYKNNGNIISTPALKKHEQISWEDIPYHLVDMESYFNKTLGERDIPVFTSLGCPHQCTFCVAPVLYKNIRSKWVAYEIKDIIEHIHFLVQKYKVTSISVFDDDSFIDIDRARLLLKSFILSGLFKKIKINFRGARISELDSMNEDDFLLMTKANVGYIMIGIESGSQKVLDEMEKGFSVAATKRVNKKFARYHKIKPLYNFFVGTPGETIIDLIDTKNLVLDLIKDNPRCYVGFGSDWKPIPGSAMTRAAEQKYNLKIPDRLANWAEIDSFDASSAIRHPWYSKDQEKMIRLLQCAAGIIDQKFYREFIVDKRLFIKFLGILSLFYRPIIMWRIKYSYAGWLIEFYIRNWIIKRIFTKI